jgi:hypothetical protein
MKTLNKPFLRDLDIKRAIPHAFVYNVNRKTNTIESWCIAREHYIYFYRLYVSFDPVPGSFIQKCFGISVLAECQYSNKNPAVGNFAGVGIYDVIRNACPANFDLLSRLSRDMYSGTRFLRSSECNSRTTLRRPALRREKSVCS